MLYDFLEKSAPQKSSRVRDTYLKKGWEAIYVTKLLRLPGVKRCDVGNVVVDMAKANKIETMEKLIHWSKIWDIMQRTDIHGSPIPFQLAYVKLSTGEIREYDSCILTSIHTTGTTINVLPDGEFRPRKIRKVSIIEFNHAKVYI